MTGEVDLSFLIDEADVASLPHMPPGLVRVPRERGLPEIAHLISPTAVVLAWAGAVSAATTTLAFVVDRLACGVVVDIRTLPITIKKDGALPRGKMIVIDENGASSVIGASNLESIMGKAKPRVVHPTQSED